MTEDVRAAIRQVIREKELTQTAVAAMIGRTPAALSRVLGEGPKAGEVSPIWSDLLDALGLQLTVTPKAPAPEPVAPVQAGPGASRHMSKEEAVAMLGEILIPAPKPGSPKGSNPPVAVTGPLSEELLAEHRGSAL